MFPIGFDSTGAPFALQLSAPAGMDGFLMGLGLALEKLFGPMPAPPSTAACSGCSSNVFYTNVSLTHPCFDSECRSSHSQCTKTPNIFSQCSHCFRANPYTMALNKLCTPPPAPLFVAACCTHCSNPCHSNTTSRLFSRVSGQQSQGGWSTCR